MGTVSSLVSPDCRQSPDLWNSLGEGEKNREALGSKRQGGGSGRLERFPLRSALTWVLLERFLYNASRFLMSSRETESTLSKIAEKKF